MTNQRPRRVYLLSFIVDRQFVLDFLDNRPEVLNWFALFPGTVLVVTRSDLAALTGIIHVSYPWLHFLLAEIKSDQINGWINERVWDFILSPKSSGRWE